MSKHYLYPQFAEEQISVREAYELAFRFLTAYWERDGSRQDSCEKLLSWMQPVGPTGAPMDPAMWHDWICAFKSP